MSGARLTAVTFLVREYDEAIGFFVGALGFTLSEDVALGAGKRWVRVSPPGGGTGLILAKASAAAQEGAIGAQAGGRVAFFLHTDDFARDHAAFAAAGVRFLETPRAEAYGMVAVFEDLYGGRWDLIGPG